MNIIVIIMAMMTLMVALVDPLPFKEKEGTSPPAFLGNGFLELKLQVGQTHKTFTQRVRVSIITQFEDQNHSH